MSDQAADELDEGSVNLLVAEYSRLVEAFQHEEHRGERPVNFFVTLATAVAGGFLVLFERDDLSTLIVVGVLAVLLVFGYMTLLRLIKRNLTGYDYLRASHEILTYFVKRKPKLPDHLYFAREKGPPFREKKTEELFTLGNGGLLETVSLVNSFIVAGIAAVLMGSVVGIPGALLVAPVGFIGAWVWQFNYVKRRYEDEKTKAMRNSSTPG